MRHLLPSSPQIFNAASLIDKPRGDWSGVFVSVATAVSSACLRSLLLNISLSSRVIKNVTSAAETLQTKAFGKFSRAK